MRQKVKKEKRKEKQGVLAGHELEEGRHVKRGWTEDAVRKRSKNGNNIKQDVSGSKEGKKLKFKTSVPPNAVPVEEEVKTKSKHEKSKQDLSGRKQIVVQESAKSSKPSARPSTELAATGQAARYEDGKGWVDEEGNIVEAERPSRKRKRAAPDDVLDISAKPPEEEAPSLEQARDADAQQSSDDESREKGGLQPAQPPSRRRDSTVDSEQSQATSSKGGDAPDRPDSKVTTDTPKEVHPLEALFKRPAPIPEESTKPKPAPIDTSFSFFGAGSADADADDEDAPAAYPPQTPRTKEDLEWRSLRSAAPTPDTAAIGKRFSFPFAQDKMDEEGDDVQMGGEVDEDADEATPVPATRPTVSATGADSERKEESEFRKDFYARRGDLNRAWKKRRREAKKQQRQRENRRVSRRIV